MPRAIVFLLDVRRILSHTPSVCLRTLRIFGARLSFVVFPCLLDDQRCEWTSSHLGLLLFALGHSTLFRFERLIQERNVDGQLRI
jgi:hypothetical protein